MLAVLATSMAVTVTAKPIVAVFDIEDSDVALTRGALTRLSDFLQTRLVGTGLFESLPPGQLRQRIVEQKKESYKECYDQACQIELGKALAANKSLHTTVRRIGKGCELTSRLVDLTRETAEAAASSEVTCDEESIREGIKDVVGQLSRQAAGAGAATSGATVQHRVAIDRGETIVNRLTDETGYLVIHSEPPGAVITLNGKELGRAPLQRDLMVGRYVVEAEMGKLYHPSREELTLTTGKTIITMALKPAFGTLDVNSSPAGADVWVEGVVVGKTPYRNERQPSGTYSIRIEAANHVPATLDVTVADGQIVNGEVNLTPDYGILTVTSDPLGAAVMMDDEATGKKTPVTFPVVRPGVHVIKLTLEAHGDAVERASVTQGETTNLTAKLTPRLGLLKVTASYADATPCEGNLTIDGRAVGTTPWKGEVLATRHSVVVTCGGRVARQSVDVDHNQTQVVALEVIGKAPGEPAGVLRGETGEERAVTVPVSLSFIEGFVWYDSKAERTHVGMEAGLALRFRDATWIRPGLALGWTVESPANVTIRPGIQWSIGPVFVRTALATMVTPGVAAGFVAGFGGDIPLWKGGFLTVEADATVWSRAVVPLDFRMGVGHAF
jgi:hypothetical protein